ncbi:hypothetical protein AUC60_04580 [Pseudomonas caspiana]|uniref:Uncharacterized protein n=1 Tax=Pseudomonas caspiana TaxID=1451454 RepID=A0A1Y3P9V2_9PSED|nr:hypothetical protein AUC60_04580 [Pseudomonas caspiana]
MGAITRATIQTAGDFVGADKHREAAIAIHLIHRYRSLAVLVSSYRKKSPDSEGRVLFEEKLTCLLP